jgi:small subunit ribosomal protein S6
MIEKLHHYEAVVILNPNTTEEFQKSFFQNNKSVIEKFKGELNHLDTWGQRPLANPINKLSRGTYFHATFSAGAGCIAELERQFNINESVLHYMHSRLDDRISLAKHTEDFKELLKESNQRMEEKEQKMKARRDKKVRKPSR